MAARTKYASDNLRVIKGSRLSVSGIFENEPSNRKSHKRKASDAGLCADNEHKKSRSEKVFSSRPKKKEELLRTERRSVAIAGDMKDFEQKYEQDKQLGEGYFGIVFAGVRILDQQPVAIKYIERKSITFVPVHFEDEEYNVPLEVLLMSKAAPDQGSIGLNPAVSFLDWFILDQNMIVLVMERPTPSEDLLDYSMENAPLSEEQAKVMMQQVVDALVDLHSKGIFHKDISRDNLLVQTTESGPRIRIIDFGFGQFVQPQPFKNGTLSLVPCQYKTKSYLASPVTVLQIGSVLYQLLFDSEFDSECDSECDSESDSESDSEFPTVNVMKGNISTRSDLSEECLDFLNSCLTDLEQRMHLDQLIHHPWFNA